LISTAALTILATSAVPPPDASRGACGFELSPALQPFCSHAPATSFKRSTKLYKLAMPYNRGLDRDKDGIACEKA
jgi:Excalibur calcium-binding domain